MYRCLGLLFVTLFAASSGGEATELPALYPAPQSIAWTAQPEHYLPAGKLIGINSEVTCSGALNRLREKLARPLPSEKSGNLILRLTDLPRHIPAQVRAQAYTLKVDADAIHLSAQTQQGLHYALITLVQLATPDKKIPCVTITDWPDLKLRGTYAPSIEEVEKHFDEFVLGKLNCLVLEDGRLFDLDNPETCARFKALAQRCRDNCIDFIPELQSLGWGQLVLQREPRAVEARYTENQPFEIRDGRVYAPAPPLPPAPTLQNPGFDDGLEQWKAQYHQKHWRTATPAEACVVPNPDNPSDHVLKMSSQESCTVRIEQDIPVTPNAHYELRCRLKTQGVGGQGAFSEVYGIEADGRIGAFIGRNEHRARGDRDWHTNILRFNTGGEHRARPGGALEDTPEIKSYDRVRIFLRIQDGEGAAWFDQIELIPIQTPGPLDNVICTEAAPVTIRPEKAGPAYQAGKDYQLTVPMPVYPYTEYKTTEIIIPEKSRIKNGDTVLLSYHYARRGDITCCPSEPLYRDFLRKTIHKVIAELKPNYLHIGHDEARFFNRDHRCRARGMNNEDLFVDDIERTRAFAREADPKIRIMMWDDAINPYQNGPSLQTSDAAKKLSKDIIINLWWYDNDQWEKQMDASLAYFLDLGFDVTGSPWFRIPNAGHWAELFHTRREDPQALGLLYTSWATATPWAALHFTAEHAWSYNNPAIP